MKPKILFAMLVCLWIGWVAGYFTGKIIAKKVCEPQVMTGKVPGDLILRAASIKVERSQIAGDLRIEGMGNQISVNSNVFGKCAYLNGDNLFARNPELLEKRAK